MVGVSAIARAQAQHPAALAALIRQAEDGIPKAECQLGFEYFHGAGGLPRSAAQVVYWWQQAAAQGFKPEIAQPRALRNPQPVAVAHPTATRHAPASAETPADHQRVVQSLQSIWTLYFKASNAQVVDFGSPALVSSVSLGRGS